MWKGFRVSSFWAAQVLAVGSVLAQEPTDAGRAPRAPTGTIRGRVVDATGLALPGAIVTLTDAQENAEIVTDQTGTYVFGLVAPGRYTLRVSFPGFSPYENTEVDVLAGRVKTVPVLLSIAPIKEEITLKYEPTFHRGTLVLPGDDEGLPDDPDDLAADLEALAGSSTASQGSQMFVDGFTGARLPPKTSIREFRTNQNPYAAMNDRVGFGRIEVFTKPGSDKLRGQTFFNFGHGVINARNPFVPVDRPLFWERFQGGNLSGPLGKRASFSLDVETRQIDAGARINATVLDDQLDTRVLRQIVHSPQSRTNISPRVDYQLHANHTLVGRYTNTRIGRDNVGIGDLSLPVRSYSTSEREHLFQLTETAVLNSRTINETRVQFVQTSSEAGDVSPLPIINVAEAFIGGGTDIGQALIDQARWEIHNATHYVSGTHSWRWGARFRTVTLGDTSRQNFGGTFRFTGGTGPELDASNQVVRNAAGQVVSGPLTALERYRRTLIFQRQGLTGPQIRALGGGASQFTITSGNPRADISQADLGVFLQDDWIIRPDFRLSLGLRYEWQNNVHFWKDLAPRVSLAWAPGDPKRRRTALRFGFGLFYDRFSEKLALQAVRLNGLNQQQYLVRNPDFFPTVPSVQTLGAPLPPSIRRVAEDLRAPYIIQTSIGIERLLPLKTTVATTLTYSSGVHLLRSRDLNVPLLGTFVPGDATSGIRPYGPGNVFVYESSGSLSQGQWNTNVTSKLHQKLTLSLLYVLNYANSDTDGPTTFPADPYDDSIDYGRSVLDERHRLVLSATIVAPRGFQLSPFLVARSGTPFNITLGRDINGDTLLTERPAWALDLTNPRAIVTAFGALNPNPPLGEEMIPRNYGTGPGYLSMNIRLSKNIAFGRPKGPPPKPGASSTAEKPYTLTLSVSARNLMNRVNPAKIVGNLSSAAFGNPTSLADPYGPAPEAGNRRIEVQSRLKF